MKFAVGYQNMKYWEHFTEVVRDYSAFIGEVFFPWIGMASGRQPLLPDHFTTTQELEAELISDLKCIKEMGIALDLLLNANCYGKDAVSPGLEEQIRSILERLTGEGCRPDVVTTSSLFAAHVVKKYFSDVEVRASVNMRIGTVQAMKYASDLFDSFYIQRDYQRNPDYVRQVSFWCHARRKKLCMLVNSGCLRFCPGQVFHDNLIAHCGEIESEGSMTKDFNPHVCWNMYRDRRNAAEVLKSTWIRPEDVHHYEGLIDICKLATRQHSHPRSVISAYTAGKWDGNLLELLEPGLARAFYPDMIDNAAFPKDFWEKTGNCLNGCTECGYCEDVLRQVYRR